MLLTIGYLLFVFTLILVGPSIKGMLYAGLLLFILKRASKDQKPYWERIGFTSALMFWFQSSILFMILLTVYSFSYYGDSGWGDSSRLPVGYSKTINAIDGRPYIELKNYKQVSLEMFAVLNHKVYAKVNSGLNPTPDSCEYLVWNLRTDEHHFYKDYEALAKAEAGDSVPPISDFADFETQYDRYWRGWRAYLP